MAFSSIPRLSIMRLQTINTRSTHSVARMAAETSRHGIAAVALAPMLSFHELNSQVSASSFLCKGRIRRQCRGQPNGATSCHVKNAGLRSATITATITPLEADRMTLSTSVAAKQAPGLAETLAREIERLPVGIAEHPIFGAHDSPQMVALLVRSLEHSTSCFPSYLAFAAAHAPNDEIRSTIISQLNEELGNGRWAEDGHANLLKTMVNGLRRELGELVPQDVLTAPGSPAHTLKKAFDQGFLNPDRLRMLGTFMVAEALAKHFDIALLEAIKRHTATGSLRLSADELRWIRLHAELEVQHEGEVLEMCRALKQLDARAVERVRAGAEEFLEGFRAFLDGMCREYAHIGQRNQSLNVRQ